VIGWSLAALIAALGWTPSKSAARRLIRAGAVTLDGRKITNQHAAIVLPRGRQ